MTRECSGCGLRSCDGRCYDASPSDYAVDPIAEFRELCERIVDDRKFGEPLSELRRTGTGGFWS